MNHLPTTILYWPPWSGKSTVAKQLAETTKRTHIDIDTVFQLRHGDIWIYIEKYGIGAFRELEWYIFSEAISTRWAVVSLGGGTLLASDNQSKVEYHPNLFTLMLDTAVLTERIMSDTKNNRPLTRSPAEIQKVTSTRYTHYINQWIVIILWDKDTVPSIVSNIMKLEVHPRQYAVG